MYGPVEPFSDGTAAALRLSDGSALRLLVLARRGERGLVADFGDVGGLWLFGS